jgi:hypothetical protein
MDDSLGTLLELQLEYRRAVRVADLGVVEMDLGRLGIGPLARFALMTPRG